MCCKWYSVGTWIRKSLSHVLNPALHSIPVYLRACTLADWFCIQRMCASSIMYTPKSQYILGHRRHHVNNICVFLPGMQLLSWTVWQVVSTQQGQWSPIWSPLLPALMTTDLSPPKTQPKHTQTSVLLLSVGSSSTSLKKTKPFIKHTLSWPLERVPWKSEGHEQTPQWPWPSDH